MSLQLVKTIIEVFADLPTDNLLVFLLQVLIHRQLETRIIIFILSHSVQIFKDHPDVQVFVLFHYLHKLLPEIFAPLTQVLEQCEKVLLDELIRRIENLVDVWFFVLRFLFIVFQQLHRQILNFPLRAVYWLDVIYFGATRTRMAFIDDLFLLRRHGLCKGLDWPHQILIVLTTFDNFTDVALKLFQICFQPFFYLFPFDVMGSGRKQIFHSQVGQALPLHVGIGNKLVSMELLYCQQTVDHDLRGFEKLRFLQSRGTSNDRGIQVVLLLLYFLEKSFLRFHLLLTMRRNAASGRNLPLFFQKLCNFVFYLYVHIFLQQNIFQQRVELHTLILFSFIQNLVDFCQSFHLNLVLLAFSRFNFFVFLPALVSSPNPLDVYHCIHDLLKLVDILSGNIASKHFLNRNGCLILTHQVFLRRENLSFHIFCFLLPLFCRLEAQPISLFFLHILLLFILHRHYSIWTIMTVI